MATINNSDLFKELKEGARIQQLSDVVPNQLGNQIIPVMEVNPKLMRRINVLARISAFGTATVYTTPANQDFYLVGVCIQAANSTASQASTATVTITPFGAAATIFNSLYLRTSVILDVASGVSNMILPIPIKLERNTNVAYAASNIAVGSIIVMGYVIENSNA